MNILNAKKSKVDNRDFIYEELIKNFNTDILPRIVDYRNELQPIRNQGDQGTCYAQAAACMKEWQEYKDYGLNEYLSPQFFYNNRDYWNNGVIPFEKITKITQYCWWHAPWHVFPVNNDKSCFILFFTKI